ncbi:MAG: hypothetical protein IPH88_12775 [Bacteroidales bacterium]|nr:hypothetical protein [Bacteroidales bacterium]
MMRLVFLICSILLITNPGLAQSLSVSRFTGDEGFPGSLVKSITRDSYGIIWAATDDGLVNYDGREFRTYIDNLPSHYCKSVICLPDGNILLSTDMGITLISGSPGHYEFNQIARGNVHKVDSLMWFPKLFFQDSQKQIWLSDNSRIYRLNKGNVQVYNMEAAASTNNFNRSFSFAEDASGNLIAFSEPGWAYYLDRNTQSFKKLILSGKLTGIHAMFRTNKGLILVASKEGLFELKISNLQSVATIRKVSSLEISVFAQNSKGQVYAGTWSDGLFRMTQSVTGEYQFAKIESFAEKNVSHIYIDQVDNIWVSSDNGIILCRKRYSVFRRSCLLLPIFRAFQ